MFFIISPLQFMDLRTRYTALVTLMTQYIKFAGDSLKRLEEEEVTFNNEHPRKQDLDLSSNRNVLGRQKISFMATGQKAKYAST